MATTPKKRNAPKQRHIPQRTCIACREVRPKRELIRVVRTPAGHVELDATGKKSGRGAYICAKRSCWEPALRKGLIEHELETTLLPEDRAALEAYVATLPAETAASSSAPSAHLSMKGKKAPPPATAPAATTDGSQSGT